LKVIFCQFSFAFLLISTGAVPAMATMHDEALTKTIDFFSWLEKNTKSFGQCEPKKEKDTYILCDNTKINQSELAELFKKTPGDLIQFFKSKNITTEVICTDAKETLVKECLKESSNKTFSSIGSLHGKYLPEEKKILIRNSASPGSLVHEYIHYLQSENTNPIYGKVYKKERNQVQSELKQFMDDKIALILKMEGQTNNKNELQLHLKEFGTATQAMLGFAPWQDLIDERSIFLLYIKFGKEFGATDTDISFAKKNMGFICNNEKLKPVLSKTSCI
jgi:hypothetical protein